MWVAGQQGMPVGGTDTVTAQLLLPNGGAGSIKEADHSAGQGEGIWPR